MSYLSQGVKDVHQEILFEVFECILFSGLPLFGNKKQKNALLLCTRYSLTIFTQE